jgi:5-formyltetrahydrofolate cyclo-ligase
MQGYTKENFQGRPVEISCFLRRLEKDHRMSAAKDTLRAEMKKRREVMALAQPQAGDRLAENAARDFTERNAWPEAGAVIAGYWPIQSEINPLPLLHLLAGRGHEVALPALIVDVHADNGHRMVFRLYRPGMTLSTGPFEIRQPADEEPECLPDIVLTPLLAFDLKGNRLGYGGGYYDRALSFMRAQKRCMAIGIGFAGQQIEDVPHEAFDQPLNSVITEHGVVWLD